MGLNSCNLLNMSMIKNSAIIFIGLFIANLLAYVFQIYVGRSLGPAGYGVFGSLMALFLIIALPANSIGSAITKYAALHNSRKEYEKIGTLRREVSKRVWLFSILLFLIILLLSPFIADYLKINSNIPVIVVGFTLIFAMILPVNRGILQGMKKYKILSVNNVLEALSRLIIVVILIMLGTGVDGAILAYGAGYFIAFLLVFPYIKETYNNKQDKMQMKPIYRYIMISLIVGFILQSIINFPTILIKHFYTAEFTGYWNAALTLSRITLYVAGGVGTVMFAEVAGATSNNEKKKIFRKALILTLLAAFGIGIIFMAVPELIVNILWGSKFINAAPILRWMQLFMIAFAVLQLYVGYWLASFEDSKISNQ